MIDPSIDTAAAAWIAPSAELYGDVRIATGVSIWPKAVLRAEAAFIEIGAHTNLQDFVMVHFGADTPSVIGANCSITHHCTIHGATVGNNCLIGINATLMDGCEIGDNSIVAGNSIVREGAVFAPNSIIAGYRQNRLRSATTRWPTNSTPSPISKTPKPMPGATTAAGPSPNTHA